MSRASARGWTSGLATWRRATSLRKWFDHVPERFGEFRSRYREELAARPERVDDLRRRAARTTLTIVFAARDREHNNAVVLAELVRGA